MKYIVILIVAIALARIDLIIHGIETLSSKIAKLKEATPKTDEVGISDNQLPTELIPIKEDPVLQTSKRFEFFTLIEDFRLNPLSENRLKLRSILESHKNLFSGTLDKDLEAQLYKMVDLIYNKEKEFLNLLLDLNQLLVGENQLMINKYFTIVLDNNIEGFLWAYSRTQDTNCMNAKNFGFKISDEEILNELNERLEKLNDYIVTEGKDPAMLVFAEKCKLVLSLEISKLSEELQANQENDEEENNTNP